MQAERQRETERDRERQRETERDERERERAPEKRETELNKTRPKHNIGNPEFQEQATSKDLGNRIESRHG